jgi:hypothetical protein
MKYLCTAVISCLLAITASAQTKFAEKKTLQATRISEKITLDGVLNELVWSTAPAATDFVFLWPTPGKAATQKTEVRLLYDDAALYVAARCYDSHPDSIYHRLSKRDELDNTDAFSIIIDAYRDGQNALQFGVTPDNVQYDSKYSLANADPNNGDQDGEDPAWDAVWQSSAHITSDGWVLEIAIPYSALRFPKKQVQEWGVNFYRLIRRRGETDSWNEVKAEIAGSLNQMGILEGISSIKAPLRLSATPFLATYANNAYNSPAQPHSSWSYPWSIGMDVKYGINEAFTLDATVIPDFGQVRSDKNVLNLSPFEVRFDENRQFFTEGTELFNKGGLFYSRRVGDNAQLLNATKISGRTKKGLGIGIFNAIEAAEYDFELKEGKEEKITLSPLTDKSVIVFDQNLKHNSSLTFISTSALRSGASMDANVSALLFNIKNKAQSYALNGKVAVSNQFSPDKTASGFSTTLSASKTSGSFLWGSDFILESDQYDPNDLGFLFSPNEVSHVGWINYNRYKPWWKLNNFWTSLWMYNGGLYKPFGAWTETTFGFNFGGNTKTFHNFGFNGNFSPWGGHDYFEPRKEGFSRFYHTPAVVNLRSWYNSDNRKKIVFNAFGRLGLTNEKDRKSTYVETSIRWRASDKFTIGIGVGNEWSKNDVGGIYFSDLATDAIGYGQLKADAIVMGRRDVVGFDNTINGTFSFNNKMNITLYARHYWQKATYKRFFTLDDKGDLAYSPYSGLSGSGESLQDVAANFFNVDLVYTWRFAPGSDLLLVYKNGIGHFDAGRNVDHNYGHNVSQLRGFEGTNNFSLKILYFLDYGRMKKWF